MTRQPAEMGDVTPWKMQGTSIFWAEFHHHVRRVQKFGITFLMHDV
jgi:hypothetical protein